MKGISRVFISWMPLAVVIVGVCGLMYATVQQDYRQSLNDPQIQMAEDAAAAINMGADPKSVVPAGSVDIARSLAPWIAVYDSSSTPFISSGFLFDQKELPTPPAGVFASARSLSFNQNGTPIGEDRVTWEPAPGVRQAIVVVSDKNGYVVAGRNMREVENRESGLSKMVVLGMIVLLAAAFVAQMLAGLILKK